MGLATLCRVLLTYKTTDDGRRTTDDGRRMTDDGRWMSSVEKNGQVVPPFFYDADEGDQLLPAWAYSDQDGVGDDGLPQLADTNIMSIPRGHKYRSGNHSGRGHVYANVSVVSWPGSSARVTRIHTLIGGPAPLSPDYGIPCLLIRDTSGPTANLP